MSLAKPKQQLMQTHVDKSTSHEQQLHMTQVCRQMYKEAMTMNARTDTDTVHMETI